MTAKSLFDRINEETSDWGGFKLTQAGIDAILTPVILAEIEEYDIDTTTREQIFDAVAKKTAGRSWPIGAEGLTEQQRQDFWQSVNSGLVANGWGSTAEETS